MAEIPLKLKALILQNAEGEGPGILSDFLEREGWERKTLHLYAGDVIPPDWTGYDLFVAMGGPMNVYEEKVFPFLIEETTLLKGAMERNLPVLGFCLGAQLMAKACGAKVIKGHEKEIGWYLLRLMDEGRNDPLLSSFPGEFFAFQWHGDTFDLPEGAVCIAGSRSYENQAMRLNPLSYGFQFHFEITRDMIGHWLESGIEEVKSMGREASTETILKDTDRYLTQTHHLAADFFTRYLRNVAERRRIENGKKS